MYRMQVYPRVLGNPRLRRYTFLMQSINASMRLSVYDDHQVWIDLPPLGRMYGPYQLDDLDNIAFVWRTLVEHCILEYMEGTEFPPRKEVMI